MNQLIHFPVRAAAGTWLFHDWGEARLLWELLNRSVEFTALVIMLNHMHALCHKSDIAAVHNAMRAYAIMRNARRGESQPVWQHREKGRLVLSDKQRNVVGAYIHRNPVVEGLVDDPLAWPFSTHRDALGLAIPAVRRTVPDPQKHHELVAFTRERPNLMPQALPDGTKGVVMARPLAAPGQRLSPGGQFASADAGVAIALMRQIRDAVSALTRTPENDLWRSGPARTLFLRCARALTLASSGEIAAFAKVSRMTVCREPRTRTREVQLVERVLGDERFALLRSGDLRDHFGRR
jgi:hypothetical protein